MLHEMPAGMLLEWEEYCQRKPFGEERADLRAGIIASTLANIWRGKGGRRYRPADFMPQVGRRRPRVQDPREVEHILKSHALRARKFYGQKKGDDA